MNENLYNFYLSKLLSYSKKNPIYQHSTFIILYQGISWDIKKYKKSNLYTKLENDSVSKKEKRIYIKSGRKNIIIDNRIPYLRSFNYLASISTLLYLFPELLSEKE